MQQCQKVQQMFKLLPSSNCSQFCLHCISYVLTFMGCMVYIVSFNLTLYILANLFCYCYCLLAFFKINIFSKNYFKKTIKVLNGLDTDQIRTDTLTVLIWTQTVCKGYQQMTKVAACNERVKVLHQLMVLK